MFKEVKEKYLHYLEFKAQVVGLSEEDRVPLQPYLLKLFKDWRNASAKYNKLVSVQRN
jgi:hypothetical protein